MTSKISVIGFVMIWLAVCGCGACANDSLAVMATGGLKFVHTDELQMLREDLYLSPWEVRVTYVFRNLTSHDVKSTVAFPMPDIPVYASEAAHVYYRSANDGDIFDFHAEVDGRPIIPVFDARAYYKQTDVTALLTKYRVPFLYQEFAPVTLGNEAIRELTAAGVLYDDDDHHPNWIVKAAYHWEQVFPTGRDIRIVHYYRPLLGGGHIDSQLDAAGRTFLAPFCPDNAFVNALSKLPSLQDLIPSGWHGDVWQSDLEYILTTAANWAGPIGHFHLELDKSDTDLVSLCPIPGLHLVRRGRSFVADAEQFTPTADIKIVLIYGGKRTFIPPNQNGALLHPFGEK